MYQLSEQEVDIVYSRLTSQSVRNVKLKEDLLEHYCCYIEELIDEGVDFDTAYKKAEAAISPNGIQEIEFELYFIMNFNKQVSMKKVIFSTGFVSAFLLSSGTMFKTMKWFSANVMLVSGFVLLILTMIMLSVYVFKFLRNKSTSFWVRTMTGVISVALIATGFLFKFFHVPSANVLYGLGTIVFNFAFLPTFFFHIYKHGFAKSNTQVVTAK